MSFDNDQYTLALGDLRKFVEIMHKQGELVRVPEADPYLEIGALYEMSQEHLYPPVLMFEDIKGCDPRHRILCNVRTTKLMVGDMNLQALIDYRRKPKKGPSQPIDPHVVETGPVFENHLEGDAVNCRKFPAPRWHEGDGGDYIGTECLVIMRDPDSEWTNLGTYRVMVQDEKTLSVFIEPGKHGDVIRRKYWARGEACPIAVCVGQSPILGMVASTAVKSGVSEYSTAGGRLGRPVDVVEGRLTGLQLPADAELVFEGFMPSPQEAQMKEGPFGEWPGYYSHDGMEPIVKVGAISHRNDLIVIGQPPTKPNYIGRQVKLPSLAAFWDALENAGVPEVRGVWNLQGGGYRFIQVVAIKQLHPGHAKMAGLVAAGWGGSYMNRMTIIVDEDVDVTNHAEVMWAMATRWDPKTQTDVIDGCWTGYIDPRLSPEKRENGDVTMSRIIIYAVRPFHWKEEFPKPNEVAPALAADVRAKWRDRLAFLRTKLR